MKASVFRSNSAFPVHSKVEPSPSSVSVKVPLRWLMPGSVGCVQLFSPTPAVEVNLTVTFTCPPFGALVTL